MPLIWYFSWGDWYHPDYYTTNHARFNEYLLGEVRELCTNYGKIHGFWFDLAYSKLGDNSKKVPKLVQDMIHELQPGAIIDNRGMQGDYDTPEGIIGTFQGTRLWETCMTLGHEWSWKPKDEIKSFRECVEILVNTAGGDGNLLLNVGPMPDGRIEPRQVEVLKQIGEWMGKYGQTIYGTRGGPFIRAGQGGHDPAKAFDGDDKTSWIAAPEDTQGWLEVNLGQTRKVAQAIIYETQPGRIGNFELQCKAGDAWKTVYSGNGLGNTAIVRFKPVETQQVRLNILDAFGSPGVLELKLTGPLDSAPKEYKVQGDPVSDEVWAGQLERWVKVGASDVYRDRRVYSPDKALEGGRWLAHSGSDKTVWLEVDFGRDRTFNQATFEANRNWKNAKKVELQQRADGRGRVSMPATTGSKSRVRPF